jgi:CxxC motif-containing protein (DUF1111 family)
VRRFPAPTFVAVALFALTATLASGRTRGVRESREAFATVMGGPLWRLTSEQQNRFVAGQLEFLRLRSVADGLGPVFNGTSCRFCHAAGGTGGGSGITVTRFGTSVEGRFDPMIHSGGPVIQDTALGTNEVPNHPFRPDRVPPEARFVSYRRSPPLFGLGLVDATPDATLIAMAEMQAVTDPATAGRVAMVDNLSTNAKSVGKFGWKAIIPTLFQFSGDAYVNELGVTSPQFPDENCPEGNCAELAFNPMPVMNDGGTAIRRAADFMMLLGPPPRGMITPEVLDGERVFAQIGCASCHVPTLTTGSSDVLALDHKDYHPYSDFLLHDMGSLGDGIEEGAAKGNEFRTAPLWGLRVVRSFLHDNRARTIDEAILLHDGQGKAARDRFAALDAADREKLVKFLTSL